MKCWKCGEENAEGRKKCAGCGTNLKRTQPETAIGQGLRQLYDSYGAQSIFSNSLLLVNGIGDVVQDVYANELRKFKNHLKTVLDAGIGRMYLEQLSAGAPDSGFYERVKTGLTEDADLSEKAAAEMIGYFDEMIGWQCGPEMPDNSPFDPESEKDRIYEQASRLIETGRLSGYQEAEYLLEEIPHWRDADHLLSVCRQRIRDLSPSPDPNPSKSKLWLWVVLGILAAAAAVVFAYRGGQERERTAVTQTAQMAFLQATQTKIAEPTATPIPPTATLTQWSLKVGDIISFGHYEQDNNTGNGAEAIEWQVLAVENGRALVISKYALDAKPYNEKLVDVTWETCTLRSWLNGEFYNSAFSSSERSQIQQVTLQNPDNPTRGTEGGNSTTDRIFLLSIEEVNQYFVSDTARQCEATAYAKANGAYVNKDNGYSYWWLRSPGYDSYRAAFVYTTGRVNSFGISVTNSSVVVRPAFWLDLSGNSSSATVPEPTQISAAPTAAPEKASLNVGDIITFGHYEQDNNTGNGVEPIEWQVLAVENGRALVISRYALDAKPYNGKYTSVTWETCTLHGWLNGEFYNSAFTSSERSQILQMMLQNPDNPDWGTEGGNSTTDRIFLLSIDEVRNYFGSNTARQCEATAYAKANGAYVNSDNGYSYWWLRSPGYFSDDAATVDYPGIVSTNGSIVSNTSAVVRPAFWLDL